jgi:pimeloyl-ACP methyl ester carboxylesterase
MLIRCVSLLLAILLAGCCAGTTPVNPSFSISPADAKKVLDDVARHPKPLDRPLVIVGGYWDVGFAVGSLVRNISSRTKDDRILTVTLDFDEDFNDFKRRVIVAVDKRFPTGDPNLTSDVDVIGVSMGGVAARYAAISPVNGRKLRIHRLFTISSPHLGCAPMDGVPIHLFTALEQMRPGSPFLQELDSSSDPNSLYPVYAYTCLKDELVGERYTAPRGQRPWWVAAPAIGISHNWGWADPRIKADILRRLRDETPLTTDPPAPLPAESKTVVGPAPMAG